MKKLLFIAFISFILFGCSNKQLYQAGQGYQKSECIRKVESEQQHLDCLNTEKKSFEDYQKERKDTIKKQL